MHSIHANWQHGDFSSARATHSERSRYRVNPSVTTAGKTAALDDDQQPTDLTEECRIVARAATVTLAAASRRSRPEAEVGMPGGGAVDMASHSEHQVRRARSVNTATHRRSQ